MKDSSNSLWEHLRRPSPAFVFFMSLPGPCCTQSSTQTPEVCFWPSLCCYRHLFGRPAETHSAWLGSAQRGADHPVMSSVYIFMGRRRQELLDSLMLPFPLFCVSLATILQENGFLSWPFGQRILLWVSYSAVCPLMGHYLTLWAVFWFIWCHLVHIQWACSKKTFNECLFATLYVTHVVKTIKTCESV